MFNSTQSTLLRRKFAFCSFNPAKEVVRGPSSWLIQDKNRQSQNNWRKETHITYTKILPIYFEWNCDHWAIQLYHISAYKISVAIQYLKTDSWQRPQLIKIIPRNQLHQHHSTFKNSSAFSKSRLRAAVHRGLHHSTFKKRILEHKPLNTFFSVKSPHPDTDSTHVPPLRKANATMPRRRLLDLVQFGQLLFGHLRLADAGAIFKEVFHVISYFDMGYDGYVFYTMWGPHVR